MHKGERITSWGREVDSLIIISKKEVKVFKKPVLAFLGTGNEIRDLSGSESAVGSEKGDWKSWDTNPPFLAASLEGMEYDVVDLGIVPDELSVSAMSLLFIYSKLFFSQN